MPELQINRIEDLPSVADEFLNHNKGKNCIAFYGKMGVGKTTFIKALCAKLGVKDITNSPTFAIINEYVSSDGRTIFHFDMYRIENMEEAFDLGYEDYFYGDGLVLIEWPEKIESLLPQGYLPVQIDENPDGSRTVQF